MKTDFYTIVLSLKEGLTPESIIDSLEHIESDQIKFERPSLWDDEKDNIKFCEYSYTRIKFLAKKDHSGLPEGLDESPQKVFLSEDEPRWVFDVYFVFDKSTPRKNKPNFVTISGLYSKLMSEILKDIESSAPVGISYKLVKLPEVIEKIANGTSPEGFYLSKIEHLVTSDEGSFVRKIAYTGEDVTSSEIFKQIYNKKDIELLPKSICLRIENEKFRSMRVAADEAGNFKMRLGAKKSQNMLLFFYALETMNDFNLIGDAESCPIDIS